MKNLKRCTAILWAAVILAFSFASCKAESDDGGEKNSASYTVTVTNGIATPSSAESGATVTIKANDPAEGKTFDKWTTTTEGVTFASETSAETTFVMPAKDVEVTATYKDASASGGETYSATIATAPAVATGDIEEGSETALISAGTASCGTMMYAVTTENTKPTSTEGFSATVPTAKELSAGTYYVWYYVKADDGYTDSAISEEAVTVTIVAAAPSAYTITVTGGKATLSEDGVEAITSAEPGVTVYVKLNWDDTKVFDKWEASEGITLADSTRMVTSFTMPSSNVTITATFKVTHTVTVVNGLAFDDSATCQVAEGFMVDITANDPPAGKVFDKWVTDSAITIFAPNQTETGFDMIDEDVTVTATYKDAVATIKDHPDFLYDVVFSDGTACSFREVDYLTNEQKANARGVVFKKTDSRVWVVELTESEGTLAWAAEGTMYATTNADTNQEDGSQNMGLFEAYEDNFPIYKDYIKGRRNADTIEGVTSDWYLPAAAELTVLNSYMSGINSILEKLGATKLTTGQTLGYWSSSESSDTAVHCIKFTGANSLPKTVSVQCKCRLIKFIDIN